MSATLQAPPVSTSGHLLRVLGLAFGLAALIGNSIGMGILRTPGEIAAQVHSAPWFLLIWVLGATYALLGALSLAELGAMQPRSGGIYPLVHDALGPFAGFVAGWTDWIGTTGSIAAVAIVLGEYSGPLIPGLEGHAAASACVVVIGFALLQWRGIRVGNVAQLITSSIKGVALIALAVAALVLVVPSAPATNVPTATAVAPVGLALFAAVVVGLQSAIYTYDGWTGPLYFGDEIQNPGREIPRSMIGGVILVLLIYLGLNLAFLRVVGIDAMAGDPFVAATMASRLFGPAGDTVLRILTVISLFASVNALQLMGSRVPYALSRDGLLPPWFANVNKGGTPLPALLAGTAVALAFILTGTFDTVLALLAFFFVANYALAFIALFVKRRREPDVSRPFRVPGYPFVPALALIGSLVFLAAAIWSDLRHSEIALVLLGLSWPAYRMLRLWIKAPAAN
ncbi:MAG: APC family permease [Rudaea sp.]